MEKPSLIVDLFSRANDIKVKMAELSIDFSDEGERVVASTTDWNYYSHLSVYRFAAKHVRGLRVLDVGCGTGYGTAYLAQAGARHVIGLDNSDKAISYIQAHFAGSSTEFVPADASIELPVPTGSIDVMFSSQAMEHLSDIETFFVECRRVLAFDGIMVVAVPAITSRQRLLANIWNKYHVTNLTPLGWHAKMRRNFLRVKSFSHWPSHGYSGWSDIENALQLSSRDTVIRETDFEFVETPIAVLNSHPRTLNTVMVARRPRRRPLRPRVAEFVPHAWGEGAMHAEVRRVETELLRWKLWKATQITEPTDGDVAC